LYLKDFSNGTKADVGSTRPALVSESVRRNCGVSALSLLSRIEWGEIEDVLMASLSSAPVDDVVRTEDVTSGGASDGIVVVRGRTKAVMAAAVVGGMTMAGGVGVAVTIILITSWLGILYTWDV